jgi:predicted RNA-binding protein with PUA-like domain
VSSIRRLEQPNRKFLHVAKNRKRQYWLFKSEPSAYSIDDLVNDKTTHWAGVRNYQVRNMLRDDIRVGDRVLFYHSNAKPMAVVGTATVVEPGYPGHTAFDPKDKYHDPKSNPDSPTWFMVNVSIIQKFDTPVTRDDLKAGSITSGMTVMRKGSRLSIVPVTEEEWKAVHRLAGAKDPR